MYKQEDIDTLVLAGYMYQESRQLSDILTLFGFLIWAYGVKLSTFHSARPHVCIRYATYYASKEVIDVK